MKNRLKLKNMRKKVRVFCASLTLMMLNSYTVFASSGEPPIVSGTRMLIAAGTGLVTGLITALGTWKALTVGAKWINASAEEKPKYQKELVSVIIATVVVLTSGSTITYIVGFYNGGQ